MGVNKYRLEKEEQIEVLAIDNTQVRESQVCNCVVITYNYAVITCNCVVITCNCFQYR